MTISGWRKATAWGGFSKSPWLVRASASISTSCASCPPLTCFPAAAIISDSLLPSKSGTGCRAVSIIIFGVLPFAHPTGVASWQLDRFAGLAIDGGKLACSNISGG